MKKVSLNKGTFLAIVGLFLWVASYFITGTLCWFKATLGMPCPGCGATRSVLSLFRGNFGDAFAWHPLIVITLILIPYTIISSVTGRYKRVRKVEKTILLTIVVLYFAVYIARMVLFFPHTEPFTMNPDSFTLRLVYFIIRVFAFS